MFSSKPLFQFKKKGKTSKNTRGAFFTDIYDVYGSKNSQKVKKEDKISIWKRIRENKLWKRSDLPLLNLLRMRKKMKHLLQTEENKKLYIKLDQEIIKEVEKKIK